MGTQEGTQRLLIVAAAAAAGYYMFGPQIQAALPDLTRTLQPVLSSVTHTMRLDPTAHDPIEDRRGGRIGGGVGGNLGRLGPPQRGPQGGMPPWEEAGNEGFPDEDFPGPETSGADGYPREPQGRPPYRRWRDCTGSRAHPRCGPWHSGPEPGDR